MIVIGKVNDRSKRIEIDLSKVNDKYGFFRVMSKALDFPASAGNWDSFLDYMSFIYLDVSDYESVCFKLINSAAFINSDDFQKAKEMLEIIARDGIDDDLRHLDCLFVLE